MFADCLSAFRIWNIFQPDVFLKGGHLLMSNSDLQEAMETGKGVAVITGASSGIGKVYADRLAARGYDLMLVARRGDRLEAIADELKQSYKIRVETMVADLGDLDDLQRL